MNKTIIASIFWGFYESSEIRFAEKYFKGDTDIVELGSSCGIVSSHFVSKLQPYKKIIAVEANSGLLEVLKTNLERYKHNNVEIIILNNVVYYGAAQASFQISNNTTESRVANGLTYSEDIITIPAITLDSIVNRYQLNNYSLVCDIEGAEAAIFINEKAALDTCKYIFIELHTIQYAGVNYSVDQLTTMISQKGFDLKDKHGPVFYFSRKDNSKIKNDKSSIGKD